MFKLSAILILILFTGCAGPASAPGTPVETDTEEPIQELADEFRSLRAIEGHFDGSVWNDDVDQWMGRKHRLMVELGDRLGGGATSKTQVIHLLAAPDAIAQEGDALYGLIADRPEFERPVNGVYEFSIYYWRGEHDFLYLTAQGERILGAGWWYAGE
jgi:hypothetical protein